MSIYAEFSIGNVKCLIQDAKNGNWKEIVYKETGKVVPNQKQTIRDFGLSVSTDANIENTHQAVEKLLLFIKNNN